MRALPALCLGALALAGLASGQTPERAAAPLARAKAAMLESFLASGRLDAARRAAPAEADDLLGEARRDLDRGRALLDAGRAGAAAALFDRGLTAVSRAMALAPRRTAEPDPEGVYAERRGQVESYLGALDRAEGLTPAQQAARDALRARLDAAAAAHAAGARAAARRGVARVYADTVALVGAVQQGRTAFVSRVFDTAEAALAHERARHEDHRLLVGLALAERAEFQPGLAALAANLGSDADRLRAAAEAAARAGDAAAAVATMERATDRLLAILRAAGLILTEQDPP